MRQTVKMESGRKEYKRVSRKADGRDHVTRFLGKLLSCTYSDAVTLTMALAASLLIPPINRGSALRTTCWKGLVVVEQEREVGET